MKWRWGTHALRGMKVLGGTREEAQQTNLRNGRPREARFARMRVLVPEYGIDRAAGVLFERRSWLDRRNKTAVEPVPQKKAGHIGRCAKPNGRNTAVLDRSGE